MIWLGVALATLVVAWVLRGVAKRRRRAALRTAPFPSAWQSLLEDHVPLYKLLPAEQQHSLHGLIQIFLNEKKFYGRDGMNIDDHVRLVVAAQACVLLLNRDTDVYPSFTSILIYPDTYVARETRDEGGIRAHRDVGRQGESWFRGPLILSWRDSARGAGRLSDGANVVLHEFAHKLDEEDGRMDGLPLLSDASQYRTWANVLGKEFRRLNKAVNRGHRTVMDEYGATSAPEFFAVATETFFEKPAAMKNRHPDLYAEFQRYYQLDPALWREKT